MTTYITAENAGKVLTALHEALGLSQREFARQIAAATGRHPNGMNAQLWNWGSGKRTPDLRTLGEALGVLGLGLAVVTLPDEPDERRGLAHWAPEYRGRLVSRVLRSMTRVEYEVYSCWRFTVDMPPRERPFNNEAWRAHVEKLLVADTFANRLPPEL
jgi:transcriptional regulator with XRE-family HTH domain